MDISIMADELINYYLIIAHKDISDSLQEKSEEDNTVTCRAACDRAGIKETR